MTLTSCAWQAIADPVGVPQQGDQQAADHDGVGDVELVLDQRGATRPLQAALRRRTGFWYQTFHSSKESLSFFATAQLGADVVGGGDDRVDEAVHVDRGGQEARQVAVGLLVVGVQRDVVDRVVASARGPSPPRRRRSASRVLRAAARRRARSSGRPSASPWRSRRPAGRTRRRSCGPICQGPSISLPRHQSLMSCGSSAPWAPAQVGQRGAARVVAVLEQVDGLLRRRGCRG